ncbi:F-box only protein 39 [Biomphalaria pfeifferi]|uniref:F-box only protein 39 n=1 Tax=Biomphalaria pfeifferi TaxID=112525 RepID=A0AAD8FFY0_BIOPF|nr:F-box only protein 39 [Biomphalaria pfeifferi]
MIKREMAKTFAEALKASLETRLIVVDDSDEEEEKRLMKQAEQKPWECLPYNVLVNICRFLQGKDRSRMALVCRSWYEATKNPSLWRSYVFYLYSNNEAPRGLSWLSTRVNHLRHATIMCFGNFDRYRDKFLRALHHASLLNLDINGAAYWWSASTGRATCDTVVAKIVRLLKTQRRLMGFQMRQAMLDFKTGMGVLDAIAAASGNTLLRLGLEDFFGDDIVLNVPSMPERFAQGIMKFPNLNDLTINYEYLTDSLLQWLAQTGKKKSVQLNVVSWLTNIPVPIVSRHAWAQVATQSDVRVYLILQNIRSIREVTDAILLPEIPLHRLDIVGIAALGNDNVQDIILMLQHIGDCYGKTLSGFRLWSDNDVCEEIEESILQLLRKTPQLTYLDLHMDVQAQFLGILCTLQTKKSIHLKTLRMARSLTDFVEFEGFRHEVRTWFPVLRELNLDFHIRAESAPNHSAWNEYVFIIADVAGIVDSAEDKFQAEDTFSDSSNNNITNPNLRTPSGSSMFESPFRDTSLYYSGSEDNCKKCELKSKL